MPSATGLMSPTSSTRRCNAPRDIFRAAPSTTSIADDLPLIRGDSVLLGQVLFNMIDNAVKYGGSDPISVYRSTRQGGQVVISVTDLGKGIAAKDLANIFEKFFRRGKADGRTPGRDWAWRSQGLRRGDGRHDQAESPRAATRHANLSAVSRSCADSHKVPESNEQGTYSRRRRRAADPALPAPGARSRRL